LIKIAEFDTRRSVIPVSSLLPRRSYAKNLPVHPILERPFPVFYLNMRDQI